jgi:murein DD-endopeptidase MepM/ murein hydrolase activator NlpD
VPIPHRLRPLHLATTLLAGVVLAGAMLTGTVLLGPPPAGAAAPTEPTPPRPAAGLAWPVPPPITVLRAFEPPPGPYAAGHRGVDLAVPPRATVRASAAGTVVVAGQVAGRPVVVLAHGAARTDDELRTTYDAVRSSVPLGRRVAQGEVIGTVVRTDHCARWCLHWGLRRGTTYLDPLGRAPVRLLPVGAPVELGGRRAASLTGSADQADPEPAEDVGARSTPAQERTESDGSAAISVAALGTGVAVAALAARRARATRLQAATTHPGGSSP